MMLLQELIDELIDIRDNFDKRQDVYRWEEPRPLGKDLPVMLSNNCNEPQRKMIHVFESMHLLTHEDFVSISFLDIGSVNWVPIKFEIEGDETLI